MKQLEMIKAPRVDPTTGADALGDASAARNDTTTIQWTITVGPDSKVHEGFTFNPWIGCAKLSAGCKYCYASESTPVRVHRKRGLELWGVEADRHVTSGANWKKPLTWNRLAQKLGVRLKVFCASLADIFEDRPDLLETRARLFALIEATPWLDWLFVTKRPENMIRLAPPSWEKAWPVNVWAGTSIEDQDAANTRIPALLAVPAAVRFLSMEPLLGPVNLEEIPSGTGLTSVLGGDGVLTRRIDWLILGGESGSKARPNDVEWMRDILSMVDDSDPKPAVFVKQLGANVRWSGVSSPGEHWPEGTKREDIHGGWRVRLKDDHGGDPAEWPEDLRVRNFPPPPLAKPAGDIDPDDEEEQHA